MLIDKFQSLENVVKESVGVLRKELNKVRGELEKEKSERKRAEADAASLRSRLTQLTKQHQASLWTSFREDEAEPAAPTPPAPTPEKQHIVGNSLLRNVDEQTLRDTEVHALSGASTKKITDEVKTIKNCTHLYLVTGTNDIVYLSEDEIINDLQTLLTEAKKVSTNVTMASLMNRSDVDARIKTNNVNQELRVMCEQLDISFADCDNFSLLRDGSINAAIYTVDGYHLNKFGVDLLCQTLMLPMFPPHKSAYSQRVYPNTGHSSDTRARVQSGVTTGQASLSGLPDDSVRRFKGPRDPLSNFFPVQLRSQGRTFHSACQLIQYRHARIANDYDALERIMAAPDGPSVYQEAKKIPRNQAWMKLRDEVITEVAHLKFHSSRIFRQELLNSRGKIIIEDTPCPYWGRGVDMKGQNRMGHILMSLRDNPPTLDPSPSPPQDHSTPSRPPPTHTRGAYLRWLNQSQRRYDSGSHPCAFCGERNHAQDKCRHGRPIPCDRCHMLGHKAHMCPSLNMSWG